MEPDRFEPKLQIFMVLFQIVMEFLMNILVLAPKTDTVLDR